MDMVPEQMKMCRECGLCGRDCRLLAELGESPRALAERGVTAAEAFSCSLCGACEAACPEGLSPRELFAGRRGRAVAAGEFAVDEYRYLFPDRRQNMMTVLREYSGVDYSDIELRGETESCFFPGCTLMTYAPALTRQVYDVLRESGACGGMAVKCCGKPLAQLGLTQRADDVARRLLASFRAHKVRELIVACPGCYYELRPLLLPAGIRLRTVYEALGPVTSGTGDARVYAVHDSCPDRFEGIFGRQVRELLAANGFKLAELAHSGKDTQCCGSGGMVSHFRPDLTEGLVNGRLAEARQAGADALVSYCASCAAKFAGAAIGLEATHSLSLLLGRRDDFAAAKRKMAAMLDGPDGEAIWARIMAD